ncbi:MAG: XTP/dITP diphosphatase [Methanocorpusculum sp.]|nr:XTP/dITP diphosphatase [Methanocorpusculum sp.]
MITVVTGNKNKAAEVAAFFNGVEEVAHISFETIEPQSDSVSEVAEEKARQAYSALKRPLIVDDTGLFIEALKGFPGVYAAYVLDTVGNSGILKLMENVSEENRKAYFMTSIAFADEDGIHTFEGRVDGTIACKPRGDLGFGYDPIFEVSGKTLAEMDMSEKNSISHRARALMIFRDWYLAEKQI